MREHCFRNWMLYNLRSKSALFVCRSDSMLTTLVFSVCWIYKSSWNRLKWQLFGVNHRSVCFICWNQYNLSFIGGLLCWEYHITFFRNVVLLSSFECKVRRVCLNSCLPSVDEYSCFQELGSTDYSSHRMISCITSFFLTFFFSSAAASIHSMY